MADTGNAESHAGEVAGLWELPPVLNEALRMLVYLLGGAAGILGVMLCMLSMPAETVWILPGILAGATVLYLSIFVHELGHLLAARWSGMTVLRMCVRRLDVRLLREGLKVGWRPRYNRRLAGFVMAFADPRGPWRRQQMWFVAGGPLANLAVALLAGAIVLWLEPGPLRGILLAICATNACVGVANLLPVVGRPRVVSDGLWLLRWRRGMDIGHPQLAFARLMGLSCAGTCADEAPEPELRLLESQDQPMPLVALYLRLRALQIQGRWQEAAALEVPFQVLRNALPEALQRPLFDMLRLIGAELAFVAAVSSGSAAGLFDELLPERLKREYASVWARCLAVRAAFGGEREECRRQLARAVASARRSPDLSQETEETRMCERLLEALPA
ncbi:site-2 protease family protein [Pseudomonas sp. SCB32]|uniref:site-2 protease family protein n=1 Tax=Pseudomonas sp. SCB32 TaxID=2653853 RepID=UPI0012642077|nr:site-2 protease family protein [Pseudomonas sp. SCB32]